MTATSPEIGTDSAATLYAQGAAIRESVDKVLPLLTDLVTRIQPLDSRLTNIEAIQVEILSQLQKLDVTTSQTADQTILIDERAVSILGKTEAVHLNTVEHMEQLKMIGIQLSSFIGWFTPILDEFRDTSIIPMLHKIDGRTQELLESHIAIKTIAENVQNMVTPMLDKLEKSPILSMLGVKRND